VAARAAPTGSISRVIRATLCLIAVLAAAGCGGGGSATTAGSADTAPHAKTLPPTGTVTLPDGKVYTVVGPGQTLTLKDLTFKIISVHWRASMAVAGKPPGTRIYAVVAATIKNTGSEQATVGPTQIWLLDQGGHTHLAAQVSHLPGQLIGKAVPAGQAVSGLLVYPMPAKAPGSLLVYTFADAQAIAGATHVGVARYAS
jgi:uncharacterized protein DUF4352